MAEVVLYDNDRRVGSLVFDEHPSVLNAERTATGFNLKIPAQIGLMSAPESEPQLAIKHLRLVLSVKTGSDSILEIGRLDYHDYHSAFIVYNNDPPSESLKDLPLVWSATLPALFAIEKARDGEQPRLHVELHADLCRIIVVEQWQNHVRTERKRFQVFTRPRRINEQVDITYPTEVWNAMGRKLLVASEGDPFLMMLPLTPIFIGKKSETS